jgi:hypothetical protein
MEDRIMSSSNAAEKIRQRAYEIWEAEGRPHGRQMEHWLHAEAECQQASAPPQEQKPAPVRKHKARSKHAAKRRGTA